MREEGNPNRISANDTNYADLRRFMPPCNVQLKVVVYTLQGEIPIYFIDVPPYLEQMIFRLGINTENWGEVELTL